MFKESYERTLSGNKLILTECEPLSEGASYEERMFSENKIKRLLSCDIRETDGKKEYVYDITSRQNLKELFEEKECKGADVRRIILGLTEVKEVLKEYLLGEENLILNPQFVYADPEKKTVSFVFYPHYHNDIGESLEQLAMFLLERTDHSDEYAVALSYGMYKCITKNDYDFAKLLDISEDKKETINKNIVASEDTKDDEIKAEEYENTEIETNGNSGVLIFSTAILILLILFVLSYRFWGLNRYMEISGKTLAGIIACLGSISVSMPLAVLYSRFKRAREEQKYLQAARDVLYDEARKNDKYEKKNVAIGSTGELGNSYDKRVRRLVSYEGGEITEIRITKSPFILGKSKKDADGVIEEGSVSRIHAKITVENGEYYLSDLNSTNGSRLNGRELTINERVKLSENDEISFAGQIFYFR